MIRPTKPGSLSFRVPQPHRSAFFKESYSDDLPLKLIRHDRKIIIWTQSLCPFPSALIGCFFNLLNYEYYFDPI